MATIRLIAVEGALPLAELLRINREFLAPWDPIRPDEYFTADGQRRGIEEALEHDDRSTTAPYVIIEQGQIVGRVTLSNIVRGAFQSCNLGYWLGSAHTWRGRVAGQWQDHAMYQALHPNAG